MAIRILVAEDQASIRDMLVMDLRNANDEVLTVAVGMAALESQNAQASDLLLLDLMMAGMDGLKVCKSFRARSRHADPDADHQVDSALPGAGRRRRLKAAFQAPVPRPKLHLIRLHRVLAPNAKLRALVVPHGLEQVAGKSERGPETIEAIRNHKSTYLMAVGGAALPVAQGDQDRQGDRLVRPGHGGDPRVQRG